MGMGSKIRLLMDLPAQAKETACRFPLVTFFLCLGALNHLYWDTSHLVKYEYVPRDIFMVLLLLIPALYSIRMQHETGWLSKRGGFILDGGAVALALGYFFYLPNGVLIPLHYSQFLILLLITILFSLVSIKQGVRDDDFYWDFHFALLTRLIISLVYALIVISGAGAALAAVDVLFKTSLFGNEVRVVIIVLWIISPLFFLSGVPAPSAVLDLKSHRPIWLKNLGVFVLVPFTWAYLGILYAYGGKLLLQWQLPKGSIAYLVLSFAVFGIVSKLVIFPFEKDNKYVWVNFFSRYYYYFQLPLLFMLFDGIFTRVFAYGITFSRYYVLALAIWLSFLAVFMILRKGRNLIVIPLSLLVVAVLSVIGPWSSFSVSYRDQKDRLINILNTHGLIRNGKIVSPLVPLSGEVKENLSTILKYLDEYGDLQKIAYLSRSGKAITLGSITEEMGVKYLGPDNPQRKRFYYSCSNKCVVFRPGNYSEYIRFKEDFTGDERETRRFQFGDFRVEFSQETAKLQFTDDGGMHFQVDLGQMLEHFKLAGDRQNPDNCEYVYTDGPFEIHCLLDTLSGWEEPSEKRFKTVDMDLFIKRK